MYEQKILTQILDRENIKEARKQVVRNKGAAGVDGMETEELATYLARNQETIIRQIKTRSYQPQPVKRIEIPKPNGGVRLLGIPTVVDRTIQQAINQVLTPIYEKQFHENSYGFRPHKRAEQAIIYALEQMNDGYNWIVDIDLERFFDTVHQDRLMNIVSRTVKDGDVISLVRKYLTCGVEVNGSIQPTTVGFPQGGNLSPLLSNVMLNELDKELESRNLKFTRFADDCVILVKSEMSARRVLRSVTRFIEEKLGLIVNAEKSKITKPTDKGFKYLGFGFYWDYRTKGYKAKPHDKSVEEFKYKLKQLTKRNWGVSTKYRVEKINQLVRGWVNYYRIGDMKAKLREISQHLRYRLRICIWKKWKTPKNRIKNLIKLGMKRYDAYKNGHTSKSHARIANSWIAKTTITNERLAKFGLISPDRHYQKVHV
ncbi:hypothetical protein IGI37_001169 [Enterococcus sp. AZ194]|uniref:group II intron reverse transcriptase/maturase n=1 Tax=Enterococcus sp. AZ194 TaxID=2774629 RepID=UPI003F244646